MPVPIILRAPSRLVPRLLHNIPKHRVFVPYRQFSQSDKILQNDPVLSTAPSRPSHYWHTDYASKTAPVTFSPHNSRAEPSVVSRHWLRDACTCKWCVDPSSGQKSFASCDVPVALDIRSLNSNGGDLVVNWRDDPFTHGDHVSIYPSTLWGGPESVPGTTPKPREWNRELITQASPYYSYQAFMEDGPEYHAAMVAFTELGLIFLRNVPKSENSVKELVARLGVIQDTFYGTTWDVISKPNAENVAYTNSYLGLHQDLLYMDNVPRIQLLHCLENTCTGGESLFSDSYHAARLFTQRYPDLVAPLTNRKVVYHYNKGGHSYRQSRAVLSDLGQSKMGVWWSPPFQDPIQPDKWDESGMHLYNQCHQGSMRLKALFEDAANVYEYKMKPGDCVLFDNRRILHGRRAFDTSSGHRWLKGAYVENASHNSLVANHFRRLAEGK
ncbi:hypothetical protein NUW58_g9413 [Xylaria curta]|uniref:Uncharacterized protein n=1 Tax=Xylaria curta TaxID=42375 RepID=A0ACC1MY65_9PEZI|nr:hypothetical protein NUW58_g9413 [Xylaria curta]